MKQGDIWLINLDPTIGAEIKKTRAGVIVNDDTLGKLPLKIIVPHRTADGFLYQHAYFNLPDLPY